MKRHSTWIQTAVAAMVLGSGTIANAVTIADLLASPDAYNGKSVTVTGTVAAALPVGTESGYDLRDGAVKVSVVSRSGPPTLGASLAVTATVHSLPADEEEGTQLPPFLVETSRAPAP
jgi:hypothetical protein